jgi:hypothetical protein
MHDDRHIRSLPDAFRVIKRLREHLAHDRSSLAAAKERAQALEDRIGALTADRNQLLGLAPEHRLPPKPEAEPVDELERRIQAELNNPHDVEAHRAMAWIMSPEWERVVDGTPPSGWPPNIIGEEYIRNDIKEQMERSAAADETTVEADEDEPEKPEDEQPKPKSKLTEIFERHAGRL